MNRGLALILIALAILAASLWFSVKDNDESLWEGIQKGLGAYKNTVSPNPTPTPAQGGDSPFVRGSKPMPAEFQSGNSRFSQGKCNQDSDCQIGGCSGEVCSSSGDVVSTCEYSDSFPNAQKYSCICIPGQSGDGVCGWK